MPEALYLAGVFPPTTEETARQVAEIWLREMEAAGKPVRERLNVYYEDPIGELRCLSMTEWTIRRGGEVRL